MQREWQPEELVGSWTLVGQDWRLVGNKTGSTRLGFALLLKFFEIEARFPQYREGIPAQAVDYVAEQVGVPAEEFSQYSWRSRSIEYHRAQIRAAFGFREFSRGDEDKLTVWLAEEVCPVELGDERLWEAVLVRCRAERIEPPGRLDRIVGSARSTFEQQFCQRTTERLSAQCVAALEGLVAEQDSGRGLLAELKADPGQVGLETLLAEIDKLTAVNRRRLGRRGGAPNRPRRRRPGGAAVQSGRGPGRVRRAHPDAGRSRLPAVPGGPPPRTGPAGDPVGGGDPGDSRAGRARGPVCALVTPGCCTAQRCTNGKTPVVLVRGAPTDTRNSRVQSW